MFYDQTPIKAENTASQNHRFCCFLGLSLAAAPHSQGTAETMGQPSFAAVQVCMPVRAGHCKGLGQLQLKRNVGRKRKNTTFPAQTLACSAVNVCVNGRNQTTQEEAVQPLYGSCMWQYVLQVLILIVLLSFNMQR